MLTNKIINLHKEHSPERACDCPSPGFQKPFAAKGHGKNDARTQMGHRAEDPEAGH